MSLSSFLSGRMTDEQLAELRKQSRGPRPEVKSSRRDRMTPEREERAKKPGRDAKLAEKLTDKIFEGSQSEARRAKAELEKTFGVKEAKRIYKTEFDRRAPKSERVSMLRRLFS